MNRKTIIISALLLSLMISGCSNQSESSRQTSVPVTSYETSEPDTHDVTEQASVTESTEQIPGTVDTTEAHSVEASDVEFALYGPGDDKVEPSEITRINASDEEDYKANGISADNWIQAEVSGFTYLSEPGGEYKRMKLGDEICGLTVFEAECVFLNENDTATGAYSDQRYFSSGYAEFEGSVAVSGTLSVLPEDNGMLDAGSVIFTPDSDVKLPVMNYQYSAETGVDYDRQAMYPYIVLTDVTPENDESHALLTMNNITVSSMVNGFSVMRANASDVTFD